ncbi:MAG: hypothetical protein ACRDSH_20530, partial [Pseudonocardiaceae bacterium]
MEGCDHRAVGDTCIKVGAQYQSLLCVGLDPESLELVQRGESVVERGWLVNWRCSAMRATVSATCSDQMAETTHDQQVRSVS